MTLETPEQQAARTLRIIAGHDHRFDDIDDFTVTAWASIIATAPQDTSRDDWETAIRTHYQQPGAARIKPGDLRHQAIHNRNKRLGTRAITTNHLHQRSQPPDNFHELVATATQVSRELRQMCINPTQETVEAETARRTREKAATSPTATGWGNPTN